LSTRKFKARFFTFASQLFAGTSPDSSAFHSHALSTFLNLVDPRHPPKILFPEFLFSEFPDESHFRNRYRNSACYILPFAFPHLARLMLMSNRIAHLDKNQREVDVSDGRNLTFVLRVVRVSL
jgi:hypothetical protein